VFAVSVRAVRSRWGGRHLERTLLFLNESGRSQCHFFPISQRPELNDWKIRRSLEVRKKKLNPPVRLKLVKNAALARIDIVPSVYQA